MQRMLDTSKTRHWAKNADTLEDFYANVRLRADASAPTKAARKSSPNCMNGSSNRAPKTADAFWDRLTPIPIVDFILRSTNQALQRHFTTDLSAEGVQIIDGSPVLARSSSGCCQSGLIKTDDLLRK